MNATTSSRHGPMAPNWWQRLRQRAAPRRRDSGDDAADLGVTCFGIEAVLQVEEEVRAIAAARDAADRRSHDTEPRPAV